MSDPIDPLVSYLHKAEKELQSQPLKSSEDKFKLSSAKKMLTFLEYVPEKYKTGPWSPFAHLVIFAMVTFLLLTLQDSVDSYQAHSYPQAPAWLQSFRLYVGLYGVAHIIFTFFAMGVWPFTSYTLTSWNLMTVRLLSSYLAGKGHGTFALLANVTRFPALVMNTITVLIWWLVLVPLIDFLLSKNQQERRSFWTFNLSLPLLNVHLLNLPIIALEVLSSHQKLTYFDLHMSIVFALGYSLFYLNVLDPMGLHFYIILTPRSKLCLVSYASILSGYYALFHFWNGFIQE